VVDEAAAAAVVVVRNDFEQNSLAEKEPHRTSSMTIDRNYCYYY
jgi:hypothetical protein